eukprot:234244_1
MLKKKSKRSKKPATKRKKSLKRRASKKRVKRETKKVKRKTKQIRRKPVKRGKTVKTSKIKVKKIKTETKSESISELTINRAPVLCLWMAVVAHRKGHSWPTALTMGKSITGLLARSKGVRLGIVEPSTKSTIYKQKKTERGDNFKECVGKISVLMRNTASGTLVGPRALTSGNPINPDGVTSYLNVRFKENLTDVKSAMMTVAKSFTPKTLDENAYKMYERFRPVWKGWGVPSILSIRSIMQEKC